MTQAGLWDPIQVKGWRAVRSRPLPDGEIYEEDTDKQCDAMQLTMQGS